jgi:hypothetical protein
MNRRSLLILGGLAAAAVGGAILLTPDTAEPPAPAGASLAFPGLADRLQRAAKLEVVRHDQRLVVERRDGAWVLPERGGYPVRPERVREVLVGLTELRLTEPRTANAELLDRLGVDDPTRAGSTAVLLRVLDAQGAAIAELIIGRRRVRTQGNVPESAYVRRPGEAQAWLAEGRLPVDADPQLWLDRDIANLPRERVRRVAIARDGAPELVLGRGADADARLTVTTPAEPPPLDEVSVDEVGRGFEFLTFLEVKPAAEAPGTALGTSRFEFSDNLAIVVTVHKDGETVWVRLAAEGDEEAARFNARWRGWAYQVGQWKEKAFLPRLEDLRRQEAPAPAPDAPAPTPEAPAPAPAAAPQPDAPAPTAPAAPAP